MSVQSLRNGLIIARLLLITLLSSSWLCLADGGVHGLIESRVDGSGDVMARAEELEDSGQFSEAAEEYAAVVTALTFSLGEFSPELILPLLAQGRSLSAAGETEAAKEALQKAQHLVRRNDGVYSPDQLDIIDELTRIALQEKETIAADTQQKLSYHISKRHHEDEILAMMPANEKLANWLIDTGQYGKALRFLNQLLDDSGEYRTHPAMIRIHLMAAKTRRLHGICCTERALAEVLEIIEAHPELPSDLASAAYLGMGDALTVSRKGKRAAEFYRLAGAPNSDAMLIPLRKTLDETRQAQTSMYRVNEDSTQGNRFIRLTQQERLTAAYQPPQFFLVTEPTGHYNLRLVDPMEAISDSERVIDIAGSPFSFVGEQLNDILPVSLRKPENLEEISIQLTFTVLDDGQTRDVEILESNAPAKLNRLMRDVLTKSRFRPALENGQPVVSKLTLTQTFPREIQPS